MSSTGGRGIRPSTQWCDIFSVGYFQIFSLYGHHVALGDARAEGIVNPLPEIFRLFNISFFNSNQVADKAVDACEPVLMGEIEQAVLEGVLDMPALVEDLRIPVIALLVLPRSSFA